LDRPRVSILPLALALLVAVNQVGCSRANVTPAATVAYSGSAEQAVSFVTPDGVALRGHLYGGGNVGVILAHMYPADQQDWTGFARMLAVNGYQALTFDFRGFSESDGTVTVPDAERDLQTAYDFMRGRVRKVFLAGASMGADAAILVADHEPVAGLICISTPIRFRGLDVSASIKRVKAPVLLITSIDDSLVEGESQTLYQWTGALKSLKVFPGRAHGTALLDGPYGPEAEALMLKFICDHDAEASSLTRSTGHGRT
jgi:pimeloyl-ACP methyl ester carboxylesterase